MKILMLLVVLFATTIGALCGIGGGVIIKPVFDLLSSYDSATINFLSSSTVFAMSLYAVTGNFLNKKINFRENLLLALAAAAGGVLGGKSFRLLKDSVSEPKTVTAVQSLVLMLLIIVVFIYTLNKKKIRPLHVTSQLSKVLLGFSLGFVSSFLGIGGGPINVAAFIFFLGLDSKEAADCSLFVIVFGQAANLLTTFLSGTVPEFDWPMLLMMICLGILGGILGRKINKKISNETVDRLFNFSNLLIILICLYNFIRNI